MEDTRNLKAIAYLGLPCSTSSATTKISGWGKPAEFKAAFAYSRVAEVQIAHLGEDEVGICESYTLSKSE